MRFTTFEVILFAVLVLFVMGQPARASDTTIDCDHYANFVRTIADLRDEGMRLKHVEGLVRGDRKRFEAMGVYDFLLADVKRIYSLKKVKPAALQNAALSTCFANRRHITDFYRKS